MTITVNDVASRDVLSLDNFSAIIRQNTGMTNGTVDLAARAIWQLVAAHIEETENRIIDAEFATTEAENKLAALRASSPPDQRSGLSENEQALVKAIPNWLSSDYRLDRPYVLQLLAIIYRLQRDAGHRTCGDGIEAAARLLRAASSRAIIYRRKRPGSRRPGKEF